MRAPSSADFIHSFIHSSGHSKGNRDMKTDLLLEVWGWEPGMASLELLGGWLTSYLDEWPADQGRGGAS